MAEKLKIIPLGGLNEIGKNMTAYEYGGEIIVVDCGMAFPGASTASSPTSPISSRTDPGCGACSSPMAMRIISGPSPTSSSR